MNEKMGLLHNYLSDVADYADFVCFDFDFVGYLNKNCKSMSHSARKRNKKKNFGTQQTH